MWGIKGFPLTLGSWCKNLKLDATRVSEQAGELVCQQTKNDVFQTCANTGRHTNTVHYLGIAADEPERIARHTRPGVMLPLVMAGWSEQMCRDWCADNDLLSPIYSSATRGGCWFCHNQGVGQLRILRKTYPELWAILLKWDDDSPWCFTPEGNTIHDYDLRFRLEDDGLIPTDRRFRWSMVKDNARKKNNGQ